MSQIYFPFAKGIPYKTKANVVQAKMDGVSWNKIFDDKKVFLICYGGFFETLQSLSIAEALSQVKKISGVSFVGDNRFEGLVKANGLTKFNGLDLSKHVKNYPVPIFYDKNKSTAFVNCLNNYKYLYEYNGRFSKKTYKSLFLQIFNNSLLKWNTRYVPGIRNLNKVEFDKYCKLFKFNCEAPFILLMPDRTKYSIHDESMLDWSVQEVRSFSSMLYNSGYNLVIMTPRPEKYHGIKAFIPKFDIDSLLILLSRAKIIMSKDIDYLMSALILNQTSSLVFKNPFSHLSNQIVKSADLLKTKNTLLPFDILDPITAFNQLGR